VGFGLVIVLSIVAMMVPAMVVPAVVGAILAAFASGIGFQRQAHQARRNLERERSRASLLEAKLESQRNAVDLLAEGLEIAVFLCDTRPMILYANRKATEMFKFDNPIGRSILAVTLSYDLESLVTACAQTREKQHAELTFAYPDERTALAEAWMEPDGDRIFLSLYETTDLRRLERVRTDFVANVSHELRTPLTTIRAMAETLQDEPDNHELLDRYLAKIIAEVDRLSLIANDLLILSAAESNPVRKQGCNVAEVFRSVAQQLSPKAHDKGLKIEFHGPSDQIIEANQAQMSQVAINLVDNAINYTSEGSVDVMVQPEGDQVVIMVRDTGMGIASEHLPRIFERFYRVDKGRSRSTGGTGLGLSIIKHIVEAHGGQVNVQSALNQGSTFFIRLPVGHAREPEVSEA
jgi:two-component system phosphate regulon sensor histidine kinase PhoR